MKLMILDGNSLANRSYYGVRPLNTRDGTPTNAVFGFLTTLLRLKEAETPDALCVAFDVHAPTFRHKADAAYKANRGAAPEELIRQIQLVKDALDALRVPRYELPGWEADDLLGTVSRACEAAGWDCVIASGDRDSLQLITEHTKVLFLSGRAGRSTTAEMTPAAFREEYGFSPVHIVDLKALMGDPSDNIPGVPGIGEKTALSLIRRYQSIDALYGKLPEIEAPPAVIQKLRAGEESARRSFWLATIATDAPLAFKPEDNLCQEAGAAAYPLFLRLEFTKLMDRFGLKAPKEPRADAEAFTGDCTIKELADGEAVSRAAEAIRENGQSVYIRASENLGLVVFYQDAPQPLTRRPPLPGGPEPSGSEGTGGQAQPPLFRGGARGDAYVLDREAFQGDYGAALRSLFSEAVPAGGFAGHNIKDFQRVLLEQGCKADGWTSDAALAAYLLDATAERYDLDRLCIRYGGFRIGRASEAEEGEQLSLLDSAKWDRSKRYGDYAAEAAALAALRDGMEARLKERGQWDLYQNAELPLCRVLADMEQAGCRVDPKALSEFGEMLSGKIAALQNAVFGAAETRFNLNSPKQLGEVLFGKMGLPHGKKTRSGWSTSAEVLDKLRDVPIVADVLEYRQYAKLKSTYADGLLKAIGPDGRVHTSFQMTATATGRLSSAEPNLQNIPARTDLGSEIRRMFLPAEGCVLVDADYSQIELRLLAHIAGDEAMIQAFRQGHDVHAATAARIFRVPLENVTPEMRRSAKAVNFGLVYGMSAFSLSQDIGVSVSEAKAFIDAYFTAFPGVRRYMDRIVEEAREAGYVETLFHRRRELPELKSAKRGVRAFGERAALNTPVQGTAADVMKLAMASVWKRLKREKSRAKLVLQVHDELIAECPEEEKETVAAVLQEEMERAAALSVPLTAQAHWGKNWLEAKG